MIWAGILTAIGFIILVMKLKKTVRNFVLKHDVFFDIGFTALFAWLLVGTFAGMMAAIVAGIVFSVFLWITKRITFKGLFRRKRGSHRNSETA